MKSEISKNIRKFRKERNYTQEQLAEAMGVSVGAVSKWESGASVPELGLIMEAADFFGISVDALIGYRVRNNSARETAGRIKDFQKTKRYDKAIAEAEKALEKFPDDFSVVYQSALAFFMKGLELCDNASLERAIELYNFSLNLYKSTDNSEAGPSKIYRETAEAYDCLGKHREAVELLENHNDGGIFDADIGYIYSLNFRDNPKGMEYLSDSLIGILSSLFRISFGFANYYGNVYKNYQKALDALLMCRNINDMFRIPGKRSYLDKSNVIILVGCADLAVCCGDEEKAKKYLEEARDIAEFFDAAPDYSARFINFYKKDVPASSGDNFGETAVQGIENSIKYNIEEGAVLGKLWKEINESGT